MILVVCQNCSLCLRIMGKADEIEYLVGQKSEYWSDKYPCPRCENSARGVEELMADPQALNVLELVDLNAQEAFAAFHGLGLPSEQDCRQEIVEELLRQHPVRKVGASNIFGTSRCILHYLELWDGTRLYFGAGSEGAVIYRIVKPGSYVEKLDGR